MKRHLLASLVLCALLAFAGSAWSLTVDSGTTDVGILDDLFASARLSDSGDATEIAWVNGVTGLGFTEQDKYDVVEADWIQVDGTPGTWALNLIDEPMFILVKIGIGGLPSGTPDHYLFENNEAFDWAVIALLDLNILNFTNVGKISHVGEFGHTQVPEPATLLLLGVGLAGFGLASRRLKK